MAAIAAVTVTDHKKLSRVWPRVEFPSDEDEGLVARNLIDWAKTGTAVCTFELGTPRITPRRQWRQLFSGH